MERHCVAALITGLVTIWPVMRPVNSSLVWRQPVELVFCAAEFLSRWVSALLLRCPLGVIVPRLGDSACLGMSVRNRLR